MIAADVTMVCGGCKRVANRTCLLAVPLNVQCRGCGAFMMIVDLRSRDATMDEVTVAESLTPPVAVIGEPVSAPASPEISGERYTTEGDLWRALGIETEDKEDWQ